MPKFQIEAIDLMKLLRAIEGPPHHIQELIFTRGLPSGNNSIDNIVAQLGEQKDIMIEALREEKK